MRCATCEALKVELASAREEIAAWQSYADEDGQTMGQRAAGLDREDRWKNGMRAPTGRSGLGARALIAMCDAPGRVMTPWALILATRAGNTKGAEDVDDKMANVIIWAVRASLKQMAKTGALPSEFGARDGGITTHWGRGYSITSERARMVIAALDGEDTKGLAA